MHTVSVIGLGYVGLPTAVLIASSGAKVFGFDIDEDKIRSLNRLEWVSDEVEVNVAASNLIEKRDFVCENNVKEADVYVICVPTPQSGFEADLQFVYAAVDSLIPKLVSGNLVIIESTCPVGTTEKIYERILDARPDLEAKEGNVLFNLAYCPERVLPGNALAEIKHNSKVVGGFTNICSKRAGDFYKTFVEGEINLCHCREAEAIKLFENSYRDVNLAFANELQYICDHFDIDFRKVIKQANEHPRVDILTPSTGVGGHCIPVDPNFLVAGAPEQSKLLAQARIVNDYKPIWLAKKLLEILETREEFCSVAFYGIAFKPNVSDMRASPAVELIKYVSDNIEKKFMIADPFITKLPQRLQHIPMVSFDEAFNSADLHIILTAHDVFF